MSSNGMLRKVYHGVSKVLPTRICCYLDFFRTYKKILNLKNPRYFQEKLNWIKLNVDLEKYTKFVDKYEVKKYIKETIGEEYLVKLYGVYDSVDDIDFDKLPNQFVLKATHGSGYNIICKDKSKLDIDDTKKKLKKWLKEDYYKIKGEMQYKNVPHRIICEEYLEDDSGNLLDYKVHCFEGKVKFIRVDFDRFSKHTANFYDTDWNMLDLRAAYDNNKKGIKKPEKLQEMIKLSEKLSKGFPHVRIDFYIVNNRIYFGEFTFTTGGGCDPFTPIEKDIEIASWINLEDYPKKYANKK